MTWIGYGWLPVATSPAAGTAVEQSGSTTTPAAPAYVVPTRLCADCNVELEKNRYGTRCPSCQLDEDALLLLDAAYWDLFHVIRYGRLLNHCDEGQVYIRLIADTCRDALAYARARLDDVA